MQPNKHHYIPIFYLKRWCGPDGQICQFSKPHNHVVKPRRVHPSGTGYLYRLYELKEFEPALAQQVEQRFFKSVDTSASEALQLMEQRGNSVRWNSGLRSAWTRFILSLLLRCPEDLEIFRSGWAKSLASTDDVSEAAYVEARSPGDPETFAEFMKRLPTATFEQTLFNLLMKLLDNPKVGQTINDMHWHVIDVPETAPALFTSDRPVILTGNLNHPRSHIALPIGPKKLFVAAKEIDFIQAISRTNLSSLAIECNRLVVGGAVKYVYAQNDGCLRFVQNRMSKIKQRRLLEVLFGQKT